jgi:hypothetical protein
MAGGSGRPSADPRRRLAFWICFTLSLLRIGRAAGVDVIASGQVRELTLMKTRSAGRHPKVPIPVESFATAVVGQKIAGTKVA